MHSYISFDKVKLSNASTREQIFNQKSLDISRNMQTTWEFIRKSLTAAQKSQSKKANKHWKDISYAISNKVWLSTKNITINWLSEKLDHKMLGLFKVIGNKEVFVKLQLLQSMKIYKVFHLNLFWKTSTDPLTN